MSRHHLTQHRLLYLLFVIKLIIPFLLQHSYYQPHRDEFLYLAAADHMDWGYMEVPPVLSVFSWMVKLLGGGEFWIKFFPDLVGGFCYLLIGKMVLHLKGGKFALLLAFLPFVFGAWLRVFFLFQPNFLEIFFWTLISYGLLRYVQTNRNRWLYLFGVAVGLGLMSKYSVAFFTICLLAGLLVSPHRRIFLNKHLYVAGAIALIIFLPNIIWQYNHNFPVIAHMDELKETQLQYLDSSDFLEGQLMMQLPVVFVWLAGLICILLSRNWAKYRFYGWTYILLLCLYVFLKAKDYYMLGIYPMLFVFGSVWLEQLTTMRWRWTRFAMLIYTFALGIIAIPFLLPVAPPEKLSRYYEKIGSYEAGDFRWEDLKSHPLPQDYADMMGWKELAEITTKAYHALPREKKERTFIFASGYAFAGSLNYYGGPKGLPVVHSSSASFLLWMPETYDFDNFLLIANEDPSKNPITSLFKRSTILDSINLPFFRENGTKLFFFEEPMAPVSQLAEERVRADKKKFLR